jgi:F-type H+-transporting ATPase subunit b
LKKILLLTLVLLPAIVLASAGHSEESRYFAQTGREHDFWQRVFNFTIFIGLLYYLIANPIKNFFKTRSADIADQLKEIETKLQAAKKEKKEAQKRLEDAEKRAKRIVEDAKKEAQLLVEKVSLANEQEIQVMQKQYEEKISLDERKSAREVIDEILSDGISSDDILLDETKVTQIVAKKVA